eukprot:ANDGO_08051.mRNA.1 putative Xaa-Pro aminopeptidase P
MLFSLCRRSFSRVASYHFPLRALSTMNPVNSKLAALRASIANANLDALIVPPNDAHSSEYVARCDARRAYVSGFTGSAGIALITSSEALLWTDGRYFLQAANQLEPGWKLMKMGVDVAMSGWVAHNLKGKKVGVDANLTSSSQFAEWNTAWGPSDIALAALTGKNLVDSVWEVDDAQPKPGIPSSEIFVHPIEFSGVTMQEKVFALLARMRTHQVDAVVVSALDEVAWLLNLRGADVDYNPVFWAYVFVSNDGLHVFLRDGLASLPDAVQAHLQACQSFPVAVLPYDHASKTIAELSAKHKHVYYNPEQLNYEIASVIGEKKCIPSGWKTSPICSMKAVKSATEIAGMKNAHRRDAVALARLFHWLETELETIPNSEELTEHRVGMKLEGFRKELPNFKSLSFGTIAGSGPNGAIIHYKPAAETCARVSRRMFLLDSGAQFLDGTTDVTRTVHLGEPSAYEKECFTRVLKGHIGIARSVFPSGTTGFSLDVFAREHLWRVGLDYRHGTGHGVGSFLNVHEGPHGISTRTGHLNFPMEPGMVVSNEPGYYEDGNFGIRIENLVLCTSVQTKYSFGEMRFYGFEELTLYPLDRKLIDVDLLNRDEIEWVNAYHARCAREVAPLVRQFAGADVEQWFLEKCKSIQ